MANYVTGRFTNQTFEYEGVNQKFIAKQTKISEGLLSRFKNGKADLFLSDRESLNNFLQSKGY